MADLVVYADKRFENVSNDLHVTQRVERNKNITCTIYRNQKLNDLAQSKFVEFLQNLAIPRVFKSFKAL